MKNAILGYWKIFRTDGLTTAFSSFYDYYYYKYKIKKIKNNKKFEVFTHGCFMKVNPNDDGLSTELLVHGSHEPETTKFVSSLINENMICVDVGANIGYYSTLYSKIVGPNGKVISIEPSPINFDYLKKNLELQDFQNYLLFNCACGNEQNQVKFYMDHRANKCQIIEDDDSSHLEKNIISVPLRKIDDIINESNVEMIHFLKIDVEGYEWYAILGAMNTIKKFKPLIQIEIHFNKLGNDLTKKILTILQKENYSLIYHDIDPDQRNNKSKIQKYDLYDFIEKNIDLKKINSYKLILKNNEDSIKNFDI